MDIEIINQQIDDERVYDIKIHGYKHSIALLLNAMIVARGQYKLSNVPYLYDTKVYMDILKMLNCKVKYADNILYVDSQEVRYCIIPSELIESIHGTIYLMPAFCAAFNKTKIFKTGGCQIGEDEEINGKRPINHIISVMGRFGAKYSHSLMEVSWKNNLESQVELDIADYYINNECKGPYISGATKTAILLAMVKKKTVLHNAYTASEVCDLLKFVEKLGYNILFDAENGEICIEKTESDSKNGLIEFDVVSDQTELLTYIVAGILSNKKLRIFGRRFKDTMRFFVKDLNILKNMNVHFEVREDCIYISKNQTIMNTDIVFAPNGVLSDHQPIYCLMLTLARETSNLRDDVWQNRFAYLEGLFELGCKIQRNDNHICIFTQRPYIADKELKGTDLRAEVTLILAALCVNGRTIIKEVSHIYRGYEDLLGVINSFEGVEIHEKTT